MGLNDPRKVEYFEGSLRIICIELANGPDEQMIYVKSVADKDQVRRFVALVSGLRASMKKYPLDPLSKIMYGIHFKVKSVKGKLGWDLYLHRTRSIGDVLKGIV